MFVASEAAGVESWIMRKGNLWEEDSREERGKLMINHY